jgi:hypothetical protein
VNYSNSTLSALRGSVLEIGLSRFTLELTGNGPTTVPGSEDVAFRQVIQSVPLPARAFGTRGERISLLD